MVYNNKFVMAVLVDGVPQKELADGSVILPFNTEYVLRFRNKNNRRAVVCVTIDGETISEGGFVIPAHGYIDIERPTHTNSKFKFVSIESPDAIDFGKNGPNEDRSKGVIVAKFYLEKVYQPTYTPVEHHHHYHHYPNYANNTIKYGSIGGSLCRGVRSKSSNHLNDSPDSFVMNDASFTSNVNYSNFAGAAAASMNWMEQEASTSLESKSKVQDGCTVEGSYSSQSFRTVNVEVEDDYTELKLVLRGVESKLNLVKTKTVKRVVEQTVSNESGNITTKIQEEQNKIAELELKIAEAKRKRLEKELAELEA